jgi:hypothetical protein
MANIQDWLNTVQREVKRQIQLGQQQLQYLQKQLEQLWKLTEKVPGLRDAIQKAISISREPLMLAQRAIDFITSIPGPIRDTVIGMIPGGDAIDLISEGIKAARGQGADPVVVGLSSMGLAADLGWLDGVIPDPADAANFAAAFLKGAYKAMGEPAKAAMKQIVETAGKNKAAMQQLIEKVGLLASKADVIAKHPNALPSLLKMDKDTLGKVLANPKMLDTALQQAELISKYAGKKWDQLSPSQQAEIKNFYQVFPNANGTTVIRQKTDVGLQLHVDKDGVIREGASRNVSPLRISTEQMRQKLRNAGIEILPNHGIHHKIPISVAEKDPLVSMARELGYDINNAANLKQLPRDSAARSAPVSANLPEHGAENYHPKWIAHTKQVLEGTLNSLRQKYKVPANLNPEQAVKYLVEKGHGDAVVDAMRQVERQLERDLTNPRQNAPWIRYNQKGERVLAFVEPELVPLQGNEVTPPVVVATTPQTDMGNPAIDSPQIPVSSKIPKEVVIAFTNEFNRSWKQAGNSSQTAFRDAYNLVQNQYSNPLNQDQVKQLSTIFNQKVAEQQALTQTVQG